MNLIMGYEFCFSINLQMGKLYSVLDRNGNESLRQPSFDIITGLWGKCDLKGTNRIVLICYDETVLFESCICAKLILSVRQRQLKVVFECFIEKQRKISKY